MAEAPPPYEVDPQPTQGSSDEGIRLNPGFIRTPPGLLLVINLVLLFLSWCIMAGWRGEVHWTVEIHFEGGSGFYLATTLIPWFILLVVFVLMLFNIHKKIPINFPVTLMINCLLWAVLLFIASCVVADKARKWNVNGDACDFYSCNHLGAAAAFGFFSVVGLGAQAFLHFREWRSP
ncbi:plasmolipin-like isoform X1 [Clytia hemisphaerica]|uniref:MARVEL domain-containing protein n=1 Tax=Clytia hemisphaerica TaxID=252671 RepID=A0A7M6DJX5_9CNID